MNARRIELCIWMVLVGTILFLASSAYMARTPGEFVLLH